MPSMLLHYAAKWGDIGTVRRLISDGRNADEGSPSDTPLAWAARSHRAGLDILRYLISCGASPQAALDLACDESKKELLLRAGASAEFALRGATSYEHYELLLKANANPDVGNGGTALEDAASRGDGESIRLLLDYGASPDLASWNDLHLAVVVGSADDIRRVARRGEKPQTPDRPGEDPWTMALRLGSLEKLEALVGEGADPTLVINHQTAFFPAAESNRPEVIKWLSTFKISPNSIIGETALNAACRSDSREAAAALLSVGAHFGIEDLGAARSAQMVHFFQDRGLSFNAEGADRVLTVAARSAIDALAKEVVSAFPDLQGHNFSSSIHAAVEEDERNILKLMLDAGANPNEDYDDWTPLFYVESPEVALLLLEAGADPSIADYCTEKTTALDVIKEPEIRAVIQAAL